MLAQLVYVSRPADGVTIRDAENILSVARPFNQQHEITGMLAFRPDFFVQVLEGQRQVIGPLFEKIRRDPRHVDTQLIGLRGVAERAFPTWSMGFVALHADNLDALVKHTGSADFCVDSLTTESAVALLLDWSSTELASAGAPRRDPT